MAAPGFDQQLRSQSAIESVARVPFRSAMGGSKAKPEIEGLVKYHQSISIPAVSSPRHGVKAVATLPEVLIGTSTDGGRDQWISESMGRGRPIVSQEPRKERNQKPMSRANVSRNTGASNEDWKKEEWALDTDRRGMSVQRLPPVLSSSRHAIASE